MDGVEYLQILRIEGRTCAAAGDVHGVSRWKVPELRSTFGPEFSSAVLVREPMARLTSLLALLNKYAQDESWDDIRYIDDLIERYGLWLPDYEYRTKLFVHAVNMLNAITEEIEAGEIFRQEDVTSKPGSLRALIEALTAGKVCPNEAWCDAMLQTRPVNVHARAGQLFEPWGWQLEVFQKVVSAETWRIYSGLGYPQPSFL